MPVVTPSFASMETVKAVLYGDVLSLTMRGRSSSLTRSSVRERQIRPQAYRAMKFIASGVTFSAAITTSPSFSRSSSSTMMTILPFLTSSITSSMRAIAMATFP